MVFVRVCTFTRRKHSTYVFLSPFSTSTSWKEGWASMTGLRYSPLHVTEFCGEMQGKFKVGSARLIRNISRNIGAVILKLGTSDVHHKRNKITPTILFPWQHPWIQSLSVKNQISPFATFLSGTGGLPRNRHDDHIVLTLPIRLLGVDDSCVR